jgi:hypothetical protein
MCTYVLRDHGKPQSSAIVIPAVSGPRSAGEPFEHSFAQVGRYTGSRVIDLETHATTATLDSDPNRAPAVAFGIVEQVDHDAVQPPPVGKNQRWWLLNVDLRAARTAGRDVAHQIAQINKLQRLLIDILIEPGNLQQVDNHVPKALHFAGQQVRCLARRGRQLSAPTLQHLAGIDHSGQRRAQFMAHITSKAGITPHPLLQRSGGRVESLRQRSQIRIGLLG